MSASTNWKDKLEAKIDALLAKFKRGRAKKTILFTPLDSIGHINSLLSMANHLRSLGHRTVFLFLDPIENTLKKDGHEVYDCTGEGLVESLSNDAAQDKWNQVIAMFADIWRSGDIMLAFEKEMELGFSEMLKDIERFDDMIEKKVALIKPDLIVIDHYFGIPALIKPGIPWVRIFSATPLSLHHNPKLPPAYLGLPTNWEPNEEQKGMVERAYASKKKLYDRHLSFWTSKGMKAEDLSLEPISFIPISPWLNLYMYPEELDYEYPLKGWKRCDSLVRTDTGKFEIPEKLRDKPGKLIFLSMGSLASADLELMKRLVEMLSDVPHRFIISKGPLHDKYELADNMWGQKFVPQLQVLREIDVFITHGGNNSLVESLYYAVPGLIICPIFADQYDNAQRIQELGLGRRLDPFNCTKEQLVQAIEDTLNNKEAAAKIKAISERMQKPEARMKAIRLVYDLVKRI